LKSAILLLSSFIGFPMLLAAQITLISTDYPTVLTGVDSLKVTTYNSSYPALTPASGGMWDMTVITDSIVDLLSYRVLSDGYSFSDSVTFDEIGSFKFNKTTLYEMNSLGLYEMGFKVEKNAHDLFPLTAEFGDSLFILNGISSRTVGLFKLNHPTAFLDNSLGLSSYNINYELSYAVMGYVHEPGVKRTYSSRRDTVRGWGKMRLREQTGMPSEWIDVLQVHEVEVNTDSFFLSGLPLSAPLQVMLGITQGKSDTTYLQQYYRKAEVRPLASVYYKDAGYTQPYKAVVHRQRLPQASLAIKAPVISTGVIFPNPVCNNGTIKIEGQFSGTTYWSITNAWGKVVVSGTKVTSDNIMSIVLPADIVSGNYLISLIPDSGLPQHYNVLVTGQ